MSDVLHTTDDIPRHQPQVAMRGIPPRSLKGPGALRSVKVSMATYSRKARTTRSHCVPKPRNSTTANSDNTNIAAQCHNTPTRTKDPYHRKGE